MVNLTSQQTELLKSIMQDKFAAGPFSGMVFNAWMQSGATRDLDDVIQKALIVRLRLGELSK